MEPLIDVLLTTYGRLTFLKRTVASLLEKNRGFPFRLLIYDDWSPDATPDFLRSLEDEKLAAVILGKKRLGVVHAFNQLWNFSEHLCAMDAEAPFLCYLQDDVESLEDGWLATLLAAFEELEEPHNLAFASGYDAPEHPVCNDGTIFDGYGRKMFLKWSQPAQNLLGRRSFFRSIGYVPRFNPDGSERGFPGERKGSHIDLYLTGCQSGSRFVKGASAPNSAFAQGKKILVVPGLLTHLGIENKDSTWRQNREGGF